MYNHIFITPVNNLWLRKRCLSYIVLTKTWKGGKSRFLGATGPVYTEMKALQHVLFLKGQIHITSPTLRHQNITPLPYYNIATPCLIIWLTSGLSRRLCTQCVYMHEVYTCTLGWDMYTALCFQNIIKKDIFSSFYIQYKAGYVSQHCIKVRFPS